DGALQSAPLRQLRTPFPYSPPTMKAAFLTDGITATQCAFSHNSCGMSLSGAAWISLRTVADSARRLASPSTLPAHAVVATADASATIAIFIVPFIKNSSLIEPGGEHQLVCHANGHEVSRRRLI